jgi:hypothetical protein
VRLHVLDVLLEYGVRMDHPGATGNKSALIRGCLANGCPAAAEHLIERGAPIDSVASGDELATLPCGSVVVTRLLVHWPPRPWGLRRHTLPCGEPNPRISRLR